MEHAMDFAIAGRAIGPDHPPYVIAELSGNHNGDIGRALALIDAAKEAGADAVKLQTYTADTITIAHDGPGFRLEGGLWAGRTLHDLYQEAHTPWDWHPRLFERAGSLGLAAFSSPFDPTAVDFLEGLDVPAHKIASFELVDLPLVRRVARTGKPVILSTGMASLGEIAEAVDAIRAESGRPPILLHCTSGYPTPIAEVDLRTIPHLASAFRTVVGLSDHTHGVAVPIAAVALGAVLVEKHFTLKRADGGPDAAFSLEPEEFRTMAQACRDAWAALGRADYALKPSEAANAGLRRSLYVVADVPAGTVLGPEHVRSIRPGGGLPPKHLPDVLGRRAARALTRGEPVDWAMLGERPA
ncbi:N-acetylneuraminate synthase [Azospirillum sp. TSO22-1]|nr:N-acetylneuraminate synthase [Azospirillum sp. TSO22-1]